MNETLKLTLAAAILGAATLAPVSALTARAPVSAQRATGEKLDSGPGELPHYRDWSDPSGNAPMGTARFAQR
jgi:hypothetical protein